MKSTYKSLLDLRKTEEAITFIKEFFPSKLAGELNLFRVSAPLFVRSGTGINDDLNGTERPVAFDVNLEGGRAEIVQSLAKWKRIALKMYDCRPGEGIYTDMRAIRAHEIPGRLHSFYVDQWDWERVLKPEERTVACLKMIAERIYAAIRTTERALYARFYELKPILPEDIFFVHAEELQKMFPTLSPKEREHEICERHGAVFLIGIGGDLADGKPHDGRAPDYDDWSTPTHDGFKGLNGDILLWDPVIGTALEISSMGIRVDKDALKWQLAIRGVPERSSLLFHRMILEDAIPLCVGGGIGQSRLCMFLLKKAHIGEVQVSLWPETVRSHEKPEGLLGS